jgi:hypothetical protein
MTLKDKIMENLFIPKGSVFGSTNPMWLGKAINNLQWLWSKDSESKYSHSGMFIDDKGTTSECLWTVKSQDFFNAYKGDNVIIAKPLDIDKDVIDKSIKSILDIHQGQLYPSWRLLLHIIPPLSKYSPFERLVCSEYVAKYLWLIGARHKQYKSRNPDT